ncbi:G-protein coupled receptor dmsr-1-like [Saccostrea cucullata]|uniref:G-protein coupled receptor dmsr-1-like n=1 Tax=Saccostrea cuccullata TaxID=36930 RepID=UPI002ED57C42
MNYSDVSTFSDMTLNISGPLSTDTTGSDMGVVRGISEVPELLAFQSRYQIIHGYLAPIICIFGVVANILNIVVLTRKNMQTSTNVILTGLAISDGLTMAAYIPYALLLYVIHGTRSTPIRDSYGVAQFHIGYALFSVVVHSISIWLTVTLALFRYIFIRFPRLGAQYCNIHKAKIAVVAVVIVVSLVCVPYSVNFTIGEHNFTDPNGVIPNGTTYTIQMKQESEFEKILYNINFWIQAILIKLLPSFLLTIFSILLVNTMRNAEKRRKKLLNNVPMSDENGATSASSTTTASRKQKKSRSNRTTKMLLAVVILFLLTETPQGILSVMGGLDDSFFMHIYLPLGDLLDIITLINNGINFVLYCTMSKQFRDTFLKLFLKNVLHQEYRRTKNTYTAAQATQATKDSDV